MNKRLLVLAAACAVFLASCVSACSECAEVPIARFGEKSQHSDCYYGIGYARDMPPTRDQDAKDYYWVKLAHEFGIKNNPFAPFVGAIVNATSNTLVCISVNMRGSSDPTWSKFTAHGEMVAMENCTDKVLPDTVANGKRIANPGWADMILYGNVETCPMCAQAMIYRGISRVVFGARASELASKRCWGQSTLTVQEIVDHSALFYKSLYLRGPLPDYEETIINEFPNFCPQPTAVPTAALATLAPTAAPTAAYTRATARPRSAAAEDQIPEKQSPAVDV